MLFLPKKRTSSLATHSSMYINNSRTPKFSSQCCEFLTMMKKWKPHNVV